MSSGVPREKALFCEALEIADPEQRRQFLDQTCGADQALRERVEGLLVLSQTAGDFFTECQPALEAAEADPAQVLTAAESALEPEIPETKRIGPYKLLQELGEGGCGVVYMAEQEQPIRRRVALKIIKLGMDTKGRHESELREKAMQAAWLASQHKYEEAERLLLGDWKALNGRSSGWLDFHRAWAVCIPIRRLSSGYRLVPPCCDYPERPTPGLRSSSCHPGYGPPSGS